MKKTKIAAVALAAVMSVSMLPQTTVLPSLGVTASAASTSSKLAAPTGIKTSVSENKIQLSWNKVSGADAYIVYKYDSATKTLKQYKSVTGTTCTVKDLTAGTKYYFKVAALVKTNGKYTLQTKSNYISATTTKQAASNLSDFVIENGVLTKYVGKGGDVVIPSVVTSIGRGAFSGCTSLTSITIPDSVTEIGSFAFCNCTSLINAKIGNGVTSIDVFTFSSCTSLTNVTIGNSVTNIAYSAFSDTPWLENQTDEFVVVGAGLLIDYNGKGGKITIPDNVIYIGAYAFKNNTSLTSVTIPNSVTEIELGAFECCVSLTNVTIRSGVTSIGDNAFWECTSLKNITIPDSVTEIGWGAFEDCKSLTSITIPNSVTKIGMWAFSGCTSLINATLPNRSIAIYDGAFEDCKSIKVTYKGKTYTYDNINAIYNVFGSIGAGNG